MRSGYVPWNSACGDGSKTIQGGYVRILDFRHFVRFFSFDRKEQNTLKKSISDGINVSVVLDVECGNIPNCR